MFVGGNKLGKNISEIDKGKYVTPNENYSGFIHLILPTFAANAYNKVFSVMTYNLENLFDTHHDQGKNDYSFLPLYRKRNDPKIMNHCRSIPVPVFRSQCFNLDWK